MTYGLRVANASGYLQIDSDFTNYVRTGSGSWTHVANNDSSGEGLGYKLIDCGTLVGAGNDVLLFIRPSSWSSDHKIFLNWTNSVGNSFDIGVEGKPEGVLLKWECYERADTVPYPTGYGLVVRRADGSIAFSSEEVLPRVIGTSTGSIAAPATSPTPLILVNNLILNKVINHGGSPIDYAYWYWTAQWRPSFDEISITEWEIVEPDSEIEEFEIPAVYNDFVGIKGD